MHMSPFMMRIQSTGCRHHDWQLLSDQGFSLVYSLHHAGAARHRPAIFCITRPPMHCYILHLVRCCKEVLLARPSMQWYLLVFVWTPNLGFVLALSGRACCCCTQLPVRRQRSARHCPVPYKQQDLKLVLKAQPNSPV